MTRFDLENQLGPPDQFILTAVNRHLVTQWAIAAGFQAAQVHSMSNVELANLYCEHAGRNALPDVSAITAKAIHDTMVALQGGGKASVNDILAALKHPDLREYWKEAIEEFAPVKFIEITTPAATVRLNAPLHYQTERVIQIISLNHAVMMVGPAGCGKTTIGEQASKALNLPFYITNVVNEEHQLTGFIDGYGKYHTTPFRLAFEHGGVWIADEIDAWDSNALLVANSALANGFGAFPDSEAPVRRHDDFRMVATANTFGTGADRVYVGRNELDAASLDRFAVIEINYDLDLERHFAGGETDWLLRVWDVREAVTEKKIRHVVSSRAIFMGTAALAAGIEWNDVEEIYLFKGMSANDRRKISD